METVVESDSEEQDRGGETEEEEEDDREPMKMEKSVSAFQELHLKVDELCPESYRVNSPDQIRLLAIADNFQRQYSLLYPDRKPLLLCPVNECGVKKFVSMTLRPTPTVFPELFAWEGCASFVADFLSLDPLEPPVDLPRYLFSSSSVLQNQSATCFESATLLCSLLLGNHYDAYCVSGYAVREMCLMDRSLQECPLLDTQVKGKISEEEPQENKYTVKPLREMKSRFLTQLEKKKQEAEAALLHKQKLQEETEQPPADPLRGLRVHCWVLVLSGSRSVRENFFIDPLSGNSYPSEDVNFLGIESVWNNLNYYVNMQDCRDGCADMVYDLEDMKLWEPVLYGATSKKQLILEVSKKKIMSKYTNNDEDEQQLRVFEMPRSWVSYVNISKKDLESRWPGRQEVIRYRKAKLEKFAVYLSQDGLVTRLTRYKDLDCTEVVMVRELYHQRNDHLVEREINEVDKFTTERFRRGRPFHLLFHRYTSNSTDTEREMEFSSDRGEDLLRRVESSDEMTESFEGRRDFLYCRHVVFKPQIKLSREDLESHLKVREIEKIVERFRRDRAKPASEDVAERVFLLNERRIELTYHLEDHRFIPSKRSFIKPREATDKEKAEAFRLDMVSSFQVDPSEKPLKTLTLYQMLMSLMKGEEEVVLQVRNSKKEVQEIVDCREQEEEDLHLHLSPWTTSGVTQARSQREEMERLDAEERRWIKEKEKDVLAPLLLRLNDTETLSAGDAKQIHQDCLSGFKQRLVEQANLIQERYEKETQELQRKQQSFQKNQLHMTKGQEKDYQTYCTEKILRINVAKKRLKMHKEAAPHKYKALDQRLKRDPRLAPHLLY
ncbi:dynein regulatory complex subunit 7 [Trematomus bernacchii]|uniref:dynein regulatory complex subunit 7 n=1 Tax=Trematomus bernacchii TaxID=40690 RepID=UPI00146A9F9C|nr:dynein regulatory complex subunit 7 [Trematomus bernacchii]XP_033981486.1 dynein regulatory complex subunit 7 [Trematomus bernacchii]